MVITLFGMVLFLSSLAVIIGGIAMLELVFQHRLIEILDRFLSRSIQDYAAAHSALRMTDIPQELDEETLRDIQSLKEMHDDSQDGDTIPTP